MRGMPTIHSSAPLGRSGARSPPGLEQDVEALVGAQQAEEQRHRARVRRQLGGQRRASRRAPAPVERRSHGRSTPWGITCTRAGVDAELADQASRGRARSARRPRRSARTAAAGASRWPGRGSRGRMSWAVSTSGGAGRPGAAMAGSRCRSSVLDGEPLEVHDVGAARGARGSAACPGRARRASSREAQRAAPRRARRAQPVEELVPRIALGGRGTGP